MSFLNAEEPTVVDLVTDFGVNILWHPSLGLEIGEQVEELLRDIIGGKIQCDILVYEGSIIQGPNGTGTMNFFCDRPMQDWIRELSQVVGYVVAIGDCATWGGIPAVAPNPSESTGMQFLKKDKGGFLGKNYKSKGGLPVINVPGCPAHPDWITQILVAIATGRIGDVLLDEYHRPKTFFTDFVQTGCTNVVNFTNKVDGGFGKRGNGCLFYEVGCPCPIGYHLLEKGFQSKPYREPGYLQRQLEGRGYQFHRHWHTARRQSRLPQKQNQFQQRGRVSVRGTQYPRTGCQKNRRPYFCRQQTGLPVIR
jgi:hydrogenase small subunit